MQSAFYPTIEEEYGVALDTRHDYAKSQLGVQSKFTMLTASLS